MSGFNIDEYLDIEKLGKRREGVPMLIINGNLDRVKSGYYPQVFYPQLASANNRSAALSILISRKHKKGGRIFISDWKKGGRGWVLRDPCGW